MRIAIVHYHLDQGGVARVIRTTSALWSAPDSGVSHVSLTGSMPDDPADLPLRVVEGLGYRERGTIADARTLVERLRAAAGSHLSGPPDVWHFHNHSLGKNPALTRAVALLAAAGERLVLQLHDLAEDGRPLLYQKIRRVTERFPAGPRIAYVFLNQRDLGTFLQAGLPDAQGVVLANPITDSRTIGWAGQSPSPLLFAPIRGIRRKNLGELVLLSLLLPVHARVAVSRAPADSSARRIHDTWKHFAREFAPRIEFEVTGRIPPADGAGTDFDSWIARCTHLAGTSVSEGFGLPFIEAATWGKPFIGRRLAYLGHKMSHAALYDRLLVPADWIARPLLTDQVRTTLERNHRAWALPLSRAQVDATLDHLWGDGWLDFGNLPEPLQQGVIERCADATERAVPMVESTAGRENAAAWLAAALASPAPLQQPDSEPAPSSTACREALLGIYQKLLDAPPGGTSFLDPRRILAPHVSPQAFHFLLSAPKPETRRPQRFRAIIFDVYGTLLEAPPGAVRPDHKADPVIAGIIRRFGHEPPDSPTTALHEAIQRHHASSPHAHPEVDLRELWRGILGLPDSCDLTPLVIATEDARLPTRLMTGAEETVRRLAASGVPLGLLSNAQCHTLHTLGGIGELFDPDLTVLSYRHGIAKPSPELFHILTERLAGRGIAAGECLFAGNDPLQDIAPAAAAGFQTALYAGHPSSLRPGRCEPGFTLGHWHELWDLASAEMRGD